MKRLHTPHEACLWLKERALSAEQVMGVQKSGHLQSDSRLVKPGDVFLAWPGQTHDSRSYLGEVLEKGAVACLVHEDAQAVSLDQALEIWAQDPRVALYPNLKAQRGLVASAYYEEPSEHLKVSAVTGTNGKTTCTWWLSQALSHMGLGCAIAGTLGQGRLNSKTQTIEGASESAAHLTTMEAVALQAQMRQWLEAGVSHLCIEASSIGLCEHRLDGTHIDVAIFTNFTQDHLDYHLTMDEYWASKLILFERLSPRASVINVDDPKGEALYHRLKSKGQAVLAYGKNDSQNSVSELCAKNIRIVQKKSQSELNFDLVYQARAYPFRLAVLGDFNVSNLLAVVGALLVKGYDIEKALDACQHLTAAPGRMQTLSMPGAPVVVIDYAHTPDAIEKALRSLRELSLSQGGQLWCVMGCGGERDQGKRALMGAAAEGLADQLMLTSDNPRHEDPLEIIEHIKRGLKNTERVKLQIDRRQAIQEVILQADTKDVILIAGKGHENYQDIGGERRAFSDHEEAIASLSARKLHPVQGVAHVH